MIESILGVIAPVFIIIGGGYAASKFGAIKDSATDAILSFVVRFAVPTLLFYNIYKLDLTSAFAPEMLLAFYTGAFVSFGLGVLLGKLFGRRPGEQVAIGFTAYFSNTVLLGIPIMERAYGQAAMEPMFGVIALHAPTMYTFGMVAMEVTRQNGDGAFAAFKRAGLNLAKNALTIGILLGLALNLTDVRLPQAADAAASMFSSAALPTALFGLGAALTRYKLSDDFALALCVALVSLIAHPLTTWLIGSKLFTPDETFLRATVLTAAMPSGMNVYIFASMYKRAEGVAASSLLIASALSVLTISLWLAILGGVGG